MAKKNRTRNERALSVKLGRPPLYPFADQDVGESFTVRGDVNAWRRVRSAATSYGQYHRTVWRTRYDPIKRLTTVTRVA